MSLPLYAGDALIRLYQICFSGCEDRQTSADTVKNGLAVGAMSYAFIKYASEFLLDFLSQRTSKPEVRCRRRQESVLSGTAEEDSSIPQDRLYPKAPALSFAQNCTSFNPSWLSRVLTWPGYYGGFYPLIVVLVTPLSIPADISSCPGFFFRFFPRLYSNFAWSPTSCGKKLTVEYFFISPVFLDSGLFVVLFFSLIGLHIWLA